MKRFSLGLLLLVIMLLPGCGTDSTETVYTSNTSVEDCYLCGGGIEELIPSYWGQDNVALINLNSFDIKPIEINRYDRLTGQLIEEYAGTVSFGGGGSVDGGFSASLLVDCDRGYATGTINFYDDASPDSEKVATFLCSDCLNELLPPKTERCFNVGVIHLGAKDVRILEGAHGGFGLGDFYIDYDVIEQNSEQNCLDISIFYCPIRYEKKS